MLYSIWRQLSLFEFCLIKYLFRDAAPLRVYICIQIVQNDEAMENKEANKVDYIRTTLKQDTYMTKL